MSKLTLTLQPRSVAGRAVKRLRREGFVPGNIFGKGVKSTAIQVKDKDLKKIFSEAGETTIIYANIEGDKEERPVLISAMQSHPVTSAPLHVDFHQVDLKQKVTATVPVVLVGTAPAVSDQGAILIQMINEVDVEALPADLPHEIELDITPLVNFGDSLLIKDLKIDSSKVEVQAEAEEQIVQAQEPKAEEEPAAEETTTPAEAAAPEEASKEEAAPQAE